jgi:hypothetical protein
VTIGPELAVHQISVNFLVAAETDVPALQPVLTLSAKAALRQIGKTRKA